MAIEYAYARVKGRSAKLLKPVFVETLIREDIENFENLLKDTRYATFLSESKGKAVGINAYIFAINSAFVSEVNKLKSILQGDEFYTKSLDVYLSRWDLQNFITVIRGKFYSYPDEEIRMAILPVGVLDEIRIGDLLREETAYDVAERTKVVFKGLPFNITREALKTLKEGNLAQFEYDIYASFYRGVLGENVHPVVKNFYRFNIDAKNISMAIISLQYNEKPGLWLEGGMMPPNIKKKVLTSESLDDLKNAIKDYIGDVEKITLESVDRVFDRWFFRDVDMNRRSDPVSFYSILRYLNKVEREVVMLRTIVYAKSFGLEPEKIKEVLYV